MVRSATVLVLPILVALLVPSYASVLEPPVEREVLTYRLTGAVATQHHAGEVTFPGGACRVEHADSFTRRVVEGEVPPPRVRVSGETFRVQVPGPDCVAWTVEGDVVDRGRGVGEGTLVMWDAATGLLLSAERTGRHGVERVDLAGGSGGARAAGAAQRVDYGSGFRTLDAVRLAHEGGFVPDVVMSGHWALHHTNVTGLAGFVGDLAIVSDRDAAVHWYYWADRATRACIGDGACDGRDLSPEDWKAKTRRLAEALAAELPEDRRVYVVVETEFNVHTTEADREWWAGAFSDHMVEVADILREAGEGQVRPAFSLGAWRVDEYAWFDRVTAAYDVPGFQTHGSMSPDGPDCYDGPSYQNLFRQKTLAAAEALAARTDKPLGLWDLFVSSHHPRGPAYGEMEQAGYFWQLGEHADRLADLGVSFVVVRYLEDWVDAVPGCLGTGEEHLGLYDPRTGAFKLAFYEYLEAANGGRLHLAPGAANATDASRATGGEPVGEGAWRLPEGAWLRFGFRATEDANYTVAVRFRGDGEVTVSSTRHPTLTVAGEGADATRVARTAPWPARAADVVTILVEATQAPVVVEQVRVEPRSGDGPPPSEPREDGRRGVTGTP